MSKKFEPPEGFRFLHIGESTCKGDSGRMSNGDWLTLGKSQTGKRVNRAKEFVTPLRFATYRIECGNSTDGSVGFVARITADSRQDALAIFRETVGQDGYEVDSDEGFKLIAYFNPDKVTIDDIELED